MGGELSLSLHEAFKLSFPAPPHRTQRARTTDKRARTSYARASRARTLPLLSDVERPDERRDDGLPTVCLASDAGRSVARARGLCHLVQNRSDPFTWKQMEGGGGKRSNRPVSRAISRSQIAVSILSEWPWLLLGRGHRGRGRDGINGHARGKRRLVLSNTVRL